MSAGLREQELASPQVENGYTRIANELLEQIYQITLSAYEYRVLLYLIRKTYGFHRKQAAISLSQFERETGIDRRNVHRAIKRLQNQNIVIVQIDDRAVSKKTTGEGLYYEVQKDYNKWKIEKQNRGGVQIDDRVVSKQTTNGVSKQTPTKDKKDKETKKEIPSRSQAERVAVYRMEPEKSWNAFLLAYYDRRGFLPPWSEGQGSKKEYIQLADALKKIKSLGGDKKKLLECWNLYLDDDNKFLQENDHAPRHLPKRLGRYYREIVDGANRRNYPARVFVN
jgi:phage replication O-like protein O